MLQLCFLVIVPSVTRTGESPCSGRRPSSFWPQSRNHARMLQYHGPWISRPRSAPVAFLATRPLSYLPLFVFSSFGLHGLGRLPSLESTSPWCMHVLVALMMLKFLMPFHLLHGPGNTGFTRRFLLQRACSSMGQQSFMYSRLGSRANSYFCSRVDN